MPAHRGLENRPQPDKEFLDLVDKAAQEKGDSKKSIPTGEEYLVVDMTPPYIAIIRHFIETQYTKVRRIKNSTKQANQICRLNPLF